MKLNPSIMFVLFSSIMILSQNSQAYSTDEPEEVCKIPKMLEFSLPEYAEPDRHEVAAESDFSFKIIGKGADPQKVKLNAGDKPLKLTITKNSSFISVKGKLPAELTGQFIRLDAQVGTELGCRAKHGWLIKIAGAANAAATPAPVIAPSTTEPSPPATVAPTAPQATTVNP